MHRLTFLLTGLMITGSLLLAQSGTEIKQSDEDSLQTDSIKFTPSAASAYITGLLERDSLWSRNGDTLRLSISRLIDHYHEPFDSIAGRLAGFTYDSTDLRQMNIIRHDTLALRWLNDSSFIVDTTALEKDPFITRKTITTRIVDSIVHVVPSAADSLASLADSSANADSLRHAEHVYHTVSRDTITEIFIDTAYLKARNVPLYNVAGHMIMPPLLPETDRRSLTFLPDSGGIIISDTTTAIVAGKGSPFHIVPGKRMPDSLRMAVETLLSYTNRRDSILLYINDVNGHKTPFWLTTGKDDLYRYWLKNSENDSITIWMGNPSKHELTMVLEEDVNVNRLRKEQTNIPIIQKTPDLSLRKLEPLEEIPVYWDYNFSTSFAMNQTMLSHWAKGGESSLSSGLDIKGGAKYTNTEAKTQWINTGRLQYANIITEQNGIRTNTDRLELNSQYNKVLRDKLDFSALFYFKTQIARGYDYPNDSVVVSKFLNPGTFTIGMGVEYIPFKNTTVNFSALSYKNTFVLDTANIDQTAHGISSTRRAKQEIGGQLLIKNKLTLLDDLDIANTLRLFSNYHDRPENIDVDWEINFDKRINWYFSVLLNLHLMYDDDIRFPVLNENDQPVTLPNGSIKKVPKVQWKEFLGLSLLFRF